MEVAAPILLEHTIPATLFVATDLIDSGGPLWWDELASLLLEPARLPLDADALERERRSVADPAG